VNLNSFHVNCSCDIVFVLEENFQDISRKLIPRRDEIQERLTRLHLWFTPHTAKLDRIVPKALTKILGEF